MAQLEILVDGLAFGEGPRWHEGRLWFSDIADHQVKALDADGKVEVRFDLGDRQPSGLGWLPDGRLLVVSMLDHLLLRQEGDTLAPFADLSEFCGGWANDIEADPVEVRATHIVRVDPDGSVRSVADEVASPNGMVISADGGTLVAGESAGARLAAFDIAADGSLSNRRVFAQLPGDAVPDGICIDAEDAVWVASPTTNEFLRVHEGGRVSTRYASGDRHAIACMLGGPDRRTLYAITAETHRFAEARKLRTGRIETARVEVAGAGWP
jgi:sugar lactone lactonase YvrE